MQGKNQGEQSAADDEHRREAVMAPRSKSGLADSFEFGPISTCAALGVEAIDRDKIRQCQSTVAVGHEPQIGTAVMSPAWVFESQICSRRTCSTC